MFIITGIVAAIAHGSADTYTFAILSALTFGMLGDFFLDWKERKTFFLGVLFFTIGHLIYIYTFLIHLEPALMPHWKNMLPGLIFILVAGAIQIKMDKIKFKGKYKVMILYAAILILSSVVAVSRGLLSISIGNTVFGAILSAAGVLFIISDAFLASQLFGESKVKHPEYFVALTYFPAQTLYALSICI